MFRFVNNQFLHLNEPKTQKAEKSFDKKNIIKIYLKVCFKTTFTNKSSILHDL